MLDELSPKQRAAVEATVKAMTKKKPSLWKRVKYGAIIGLFAGFLASGYKESAIRAYASSEQAQREVAALLGENYDKRTTFSKARDTLKRFVGQSAGPEPVTVGKTFWGKKMKGADGKKQVVDIGRVKVLRGVPKHMSLKPSLPVNYTAGKYGLRGSVAGAGVGAGLWAASKLRGLKIPKRKKYTLPRR